MRRLIRSAGAVLASCLLAASLATPAGATPGPERHEWWFDSFAIQSIVWPITKGQGVTVAVLDEGVNASLPEFRGAVLSGADFDGTGTDGRKDLDTASGHGTAMASLIAAQGGGPTGFVGIAPDAKILPIRDTLKSPDEEEKAIDYAVDHGAKVISMSHAANADGYPGNCPRQVLDASAYAARHGVVLVAAAGNTGDAGNVPYYPAACPGVLAVGAYDHLGNAWKSTQRQSYVTTAGPGFDVASIGKDGRLYTGGHGTSQATALVAGAIALIRSKFPNESARQIVQRVIATVTDVGPPGKDDQTGYGALSLRKALRTQTIPSNTPDPVYQRLDQALAAQHRTPAASSTPAASKKSSSASSLLLPIGGAILVIIVVIVIAVIARSRRRPPTSGMPGGGGSGAYPPGPGNDAWAPPSGPPAYGQGAPPPPPGSGRPTFEPPPNQGPPFGGR